MKAFFICIFLLFPSTDCIAIADSMHTCAALAAFFNDTSVKSYLKMLRPETTSFADLSGFFNGCGSVSSGRRVFIILDSSSHNNAEGHVVPITVKKSKELEWHLIMADIWSEVQIECDLIKKGDIYMVDALKYYLTD